MLSRVPTVSSNRFQPKLKVTQRLALTSKRAVRPQRFHGQMMVSNKAGGFLEGFINSVTEAIANSPINQYKIKLAKFQAGDYDEAAVKARVDQQISDNPVMMYSFSTCPFCKNAKALLDGMEVPYTVLELNEMGKEGLAIRSELAKMTSRTSMPNIFIGGKSIGGCNDGPGIMTLNREGKLNQMLTDAGVSDKGGSDAAPPSAQGPTAEVDAVQEATQWVDNWKAKKP